MTKPVEKLKSILYSLSSDSHLAVHRNRSQANSDLKPAGNDSEQSQSDGLDSFSEKTLPQDMEQYDLSDPNAIELLIDEEEESTQEDDSEEDRRTQQLREVQKTLLSVEIARQKGVEVQGDRICVPGRAPLTTFTLLEILLCTLGFATGFIHFTAMAKNFLLAQFVVSTLLFLQIILYHSSYRAMRTFMTIIQVIGTLIIMALVGWAFTDLIIHPLPGVNHHLMLGLSLVFFSCIPAAMIAHLVYFGRGYRYIEIKHKKTAAETPTKILKTPSNTPTKII